MVARQTAWRRRSPDGSARRSRISAAGARRMRSGFAGEILSVDPGHAQTLHLLGLIEHQRGRSDDAIEHIRTAIMRDGRDPAFHHNLGNILRALGRPAEAMSCYERALALAPTSVDTLYNLGNTCQDLGQPERAIAYFERALRLRPEAIELHNNLGTGVAGSRPVRRSDRLLSQGAGAPAGSLSRASTTSVARCRRRGSWMRRRPAMSALLRFGRIVSRALSDSAS